MMAGKKMPALLHHLMALISFQNLSDFSSLLFPMMAIMATGMPTVGFFSLFPRSHRLRIFWV